MKIRITREIPIANPPAVGTIFEVIGEQESTGRGTRMYYIINDGIKTGVYPRECEVVNEEGERKCLEN